MSIIKLANAASRAFQAGRLSVEGAAKLRQLGGIRSTDRILSGMERGYENIIKKKNIGVISGDNLSERLNIAAMGGHGANGPTNEIYDIKHSPLKYLSPIYSFNKKKNLANRVLATRHELHELNEYKKNSQSFIPPSIHRKASDLQVGLAKTLRVPVVFAERHTKEGTIHHRTIKRLRQALDEDINKRIGTPVGRHYNLAVLGKESNDQNLVGGLYGADNNLNKFRKNVSKESSLLKRFTGKEYGQHFSNRDLRKLRNAKPDFNIDFGTSGYITD